MIVNTAAMITHVNEKLMPEDIEGSETVTLHGLDEQLVIGKIIRDTLLNIGVHFGAIASSVLVSHVVEKGKCCPVTNLNDGNRYIRIKKGTPIGNLEEVDIIKEETSEENENLIPDVKRGIIETQSQVLTAPGQYPEEMNVLLSICNWGSRSVQVGTAQSVYVSFGFHSHIAARGVSLKQLEDLDYLLWNYKCVEVGQIGLDFTTRLECKRCHTRWHTPEQCQQQTRDCQEKALLKMLQIAQRRLVEPVVLLLADPGFSKRDGAAHEKKNDSADKIVLKA
ncbi:tatD [Mytilus coruscus]|uniref:TatD n=1 Tax=Mytilus coruscus TaxID=42192 RepID=A0A6J8E348_MYTCO|nr:tatD [Mytilus coruscus]